MSDSHAFFNVLIILNGGFLKMIVLALTNPMFLSTRSATKSRNDHHIHYCTQILPSNIRRTHTYSQTNMCRRESPHSPLWLLVRECPETLQGLPWFRPKNVSSSNVQGYIQEAVLLSVYRIEAWRRDWQTERIEELPFGDTWHSENRRSEYSRVLGNVGQDGDRNGVWE